MAKSLHPERETQNRIVTFFRTFPNLRITQTKKFIVF